MNETKTDWVTLTLTEGANRGKLRRLERIRQLGSPLGVLADIHRRKMSAHSDSSFPIQPLQSTGQSRPLNYLGPITFNSLPTNIKTSPSFSFFKKRLREKILF